MLIIAKSSSWYLYLWQMGKYWWSNDAVVLWNICKMQKKQQGNNCIGQYLKEHKIVCFKSKLVTPNCDYPWAAVNIKIIICLNCHQDIETVLCVRLTGRGQQVRLYNYKYALNSKRFLSNINMLTKRRRTSSKEEEKRRKRKSSIYNGWTPASTWRVQGRQKRSQEQPLIVQRAKLNGI